MILYTAVSCEFSLCLVCANMTAGLQSEYTDCINTYVNCKLASRISADPVCGRLPMSVFASPDTTLLLLPSSLFPFLLSLFTAHFETVKIESIESNIDMESKNHNC